MTNPRRGLAVDVVTRLREAGYQSLFAGGCVRDVLLGLDPVDYDVATNATPEQVMALFRRTVPVGVSFGVVRVIGAKEAGEIEVATFRSDGVYLDGRRPSSVQFGTAEADASRRDFSINGMFLDPLTNELFDYVGGRDDLTNRVIRAIGDPEARFSEDKLRLLRAVRFAAKFDFQIESGTEAAVVKMSSQVRQVAAERIAQELRKMLVHSGRTRALNMALDNGLVAAILPDLLPMKGLKQDKSVLPGGDLWDHTMLVLENLPESPSFALALAALLHDVGKPLSKGLLDGRTTFFNHEYVGRRIAETIAYDLKLSNAERERVAWLVESHQLLSDPTHMREAKLKRLLTANGIEELLALHRADAMASTGDVSHVDYCEWYLAEQPTGPINPPPLVSGHDLVQNGWTPGPGFADLLDKAREAQLERLVNSKKDALEWLEQFRTTSGAVETRENTP